MKIYLKYFLIGVGIILGIVILVRLFTPRITLSQDTEGYQQKLENLEKNNLELIKKQIELDSAAADYELRISNIEIRLEDVGQSKIIIQKIYNDRITKSKTSSPSDLDTFFKQRYNY
jgi:hypothetical protein